MLIINYFPNFKCEIEVKVVDFVLLRFHFSTRESKNFVFKHDKRSCEKIFGRWAKLNVPSRRDERLLGWLGPSVSCASVRTRIGKYPFNCCHCEWRSSVVSI